MRNTLAKLLAAALLLVGPALVRAQAQTMTFHTDYATARQESERRGLPLILYFTTDNCPWCVRLVNETFSDPTVAKMMSEKFVGLKVHASREPILVERLAIPYFPTVILAAPDGKILGRVEGFQEAPRFYDNLQRAVSVAATSTPDWMQRDYQLAQKAVDERDYSRAIALLRPVLADGKARPVQVNAAALLRRAEQMTVAEMNPFKEPSQAKQTPDASQSASDNGPPAAVARGNPAPQTTPQTPGVLTNMAKPQDARPSQRSLRALDVLAQAKDDFRTEQWLCCLDRCDLLIANYGDLPEVREALQMAGIIRSNPEWMQKTCDSLNGRLAEMYLALTEAWVQKGQPQQGMLCLERVTRMFPGTRYAEMARYRMTQLQGMKPHQSDFPLVAAPK